MVPVMKDPGRASPVGDLWRRTLSQIPTEYGKLVYLTSLRNMDTGQYEHHGLAMSFGMAAADRAIRASHEQLFREWLAAPLAQQAGDLDAYMNELPFERNAMVETWLQLEPYRNLVPVDSADAERELFCTDLETLLELIKGGRGGGPAPSA